MVEESAGGCLKEQNKEEGKDKGQDASRERGSRVGGSETGDKAGAKLLALGKGGVLLGADKDILRGELDVLRVDDVSLPEETTGNIVRDGTEDVGTLLTVSGVAVSVEAGGVADGPSLEVSVGGREGSIDLGVVVAADPLGGVKVLLTVKGAKKVGLKVGDEALLVGGVGGERCSNTVLVPSALLSVLRDAGVETIKFVVVSGKGDAEASLIVVAVSATTLPVVSFDGASGDGSLKESSVRVHTIELVSNGARVHHATVSVVGGPCSMPIGGVLLKLGRDEHSKEANGKGNLQHLRLVF